MRGKPRFVTKAIVLSSIRGNGGTKEPRAAGVAADLRPLGRTGLPRARPDTAAQRATGTGPSPRKIQVRRGSLPGRGRSSGSWTRDIAVPPTVRRFPAREEPVPEAKVVSTHRCGAAPDL